MITPVGITVEDYCEAIRTGVSHARMTFSGGTVLTDDDFEQGGIVVRDYMNSDTDLTFGTASSTEVTASILHSAKTDALNWTEEFTLEFGVEINGTVEWITVGYFTGARPQKAYSDVITFVAYDRMTKFEKIADDWISNIEYPCTLGDIYDSLCQYVGITNESGDEIADNLSRTFTVAPFAAKGIACRRVLQWIAEACGCYAKIMANGKIKLIWFGDCTADYSLVLDNIFSLDVSKYNEQSKRWEDLESYTWEELEEYTWADIEGYYQPTKVNAVKVYNSGADYTNIVPYSDVEYNFYPIVDNPFVLSDTRSVETNIAMNLFTRLSAFGQYTPATVNAVGNWLIETGDIINFEYEENTFINLPIFNRTIHWNGSVTCVYETTGNVERQVVGETAKEELQIGSMSQGLAKQIVENIENTVYVKKTGIEINENGIDISGTKTVEIHSGGKFEVESENFVLSSEEKKMEMGAWTFDENGMVALISHDEDEGDTYFTISQQQAKPNNLGVDVCYENGGLKFYMKSIIYNYINTNVFSFLCVDSPMNEWRGMLGTHNQSTITGIQGVGHRDSILSWMMTNEVFAYELMPYYSGADQFYEDNWGGGNASNILRCGQIGRTRFRWDAVYCNVLYYESQSQLSSRELKRDIKALPSVGETIDKLNPVSFKYKDSDENRMGLIYEETVEVLPDICIGDKDAKPEEKGINYVELIPVMLKEIQDLRKRVAELEQIVKGGKQ